VDSAAHNDRVSRRYGLEATLIGVIGIVIATLGLVTHLIRPHTPLDQSPSVTSKLGSMSSFPASTTGTLAPPPLKSASQNKRHSASSSRARPSDPRVVVIGPNSIRGRFTLLGIDRKPDTSTSDELTLRLRVVSLALADLVTPFQSAMLEGGSRYNRTTSSRILFRRATSGIRMSSSAFPRIRNRRTPRYASITTLSQRKSHWNSRHVPEPVSTRSNHGQMRRREQDPHRDSRGCDRPHALW
jgi:hypothetical protein